MNRWPVPRGTPRGPHRDEVSCAEHHTAAVSDSGVLYTWGRGQNGRLGCAGTLLTNPRLETTAPFWRSKQNPEQNSKP